MCVCGGSDFVTASPGDGGVAACLSHLDGLVCFAVFRSFRSMLRN